MSVKMYYANEQASVKNLENQEPRHTCELCGANGEVPFRSSYVCEKCVNYVKSYYPQHHNL